MSQCRAVRSKKRFLGRFPVSNSESHLTDAPLRDGKKTGQKQHPEPVVPQNKTRPLSEATATNAGNHIMDFSLSTSFGADFDENFLTELEKVEKTYKKPSPKNAAACSKNSATNKSSARVLNTVQHTNRQPPKNTTPGKQGKRTQPTRTSPRLNNARKITSEESPRSTAEKVSSRLNRSRTSRKQSNKTSPNNSVLSKSKVTKTPKSTQKKTTKSNGNNIGQMQTGVDSPVAGGRLKGQEAMMSPVLCGTDQSPQLLSPMFMSTPRDTQRQQQQQEKMGQNATPVIVTQNETFNSDLKRKHEDSPEVNQRRSSAKHLKLDHSLKAIDGERGDGHRKTGQPATSPGGTFTDAPRWKREEKSRNKSSENGDELAVSRDKLSVSRDKLSVSRDKLELSSWGLPERVLACYEKLGVRTLFEWQAECLCTQGVLEGSNLVYSAPTSAGKTLVAELLMLKRVLETNTKAILILPFVSIVREKVHTLQGLFQDVGVKVGGYMGGQSPPGGFKSVHIAVCTIEKANSLINRLIEEDNLNLLGTLVVDELHMVGDDHRGYLLELLLTKVRFLARSTQLGVQIIGMSATLPNLALLAAWLDARLYVTHYRPVPLTELLKVGSELYDTNMKCVRKVGVASVERGVASVERGVASLKMGVASREMDVALVKGGVATMEGGLVSLAGDEGDVAMLCWETTRLGHSVLVFCPTKNWCEKLALNISRIFYLLITTPEEGRNAPRDNQEFQAASERVFGQALNGDKLQDVVEQLRRSPAGLDPTLARSLALGVAFHHAGLTFDERDIVEGAFRQGVLRVLVATSTLSSGVNLPAHRVIIRSPVFHGSLLDTLTYKQMAGRAGRQGVHTSGESIVVCKTTEKSQAARLLSSVLPPVTSCLLRRGSSLTASMKRAILEIVVSGVASTADDVENYASCTLLATSLSQQDDASDAAPITECLQYLLDHEFIAKTTTSDGGIQYTSTQLGCAVLASALSPDEGLTVFAELHRARRCLVLENDLHLVYLVTPLYLGEQLGSLDWHLYLCLWEALTPDARRVGELVGVEDSFLTRAVSGRVPGRTEYRALQVHRRFYLALVVLDLIQEVSLSQVCGKYQCSKGMTQSLQQAAATYAGMVMVFCRRLGWVHMETLLEAFQSRLTFGVQRELVDLVRISLLNAPRARALYNGGLQTVAQVALAQSATVEGLLRKAVPFQSKHAAGGESEWEVAQRQRRRGIWVSGRGQALTEAESAVLIIQEARSLLSCDVAQLGVQWQGPRGDTKVKQEDNSPKTSTASQSTSQKSLRSLDGDCTMGHSVLTPPVTVTVSSQHDNASIKTNDHNNSCITTTSHHSNTSITRNLHDNACITTSSHLGNTSIATCHHGNSSKTCAIAPNGQSNSSTMKRDKISITSSALSPFASPTEGSFTALLRRKKTSDCHVPHVSVENSGSSGMLNEDSRPTNQACPEKAGETGEVRQGNVQGKSCGEEISREVVVGLGDVAVDSGGQAGDMVGCMDDSFVVDTQVLHLLASVSKPHPGQSGRRTDHSHDNVAGESRNSFRNDQSVLMSPTLFSQNTEAESPTTRYMSNYISQAVQQTDLNRHSNRVTALPVSHNMTTSPLISCTKSPVVKPITSPLDHAPSDDTHLSPAHSSHAHLNNTTSPLLPASQSDRLDLGQEGYFSGEGLFADCSLDDTAEETEESRSRLLVDENGCYNSLEMEDEDDELDMALCSYDKASLLADITPLSDLPLNTKPSVAEKRQESIVNGNCLVNDNAPKHDFPVASDSHAMTDTFTFSMLDKVLDLTGGCQYRCKQQPVVAKKSHLVARSSSVAKDKDTSDVAQTDKAVTEKAAVSDINRSVNSSMASDYVPPTPPEEQDIAPISRSDSCKGLIGGTTPVRKNSTRTNKPSTEREPKGAESADNHETAEVFQPKRADNHRSLGRCVLPSTTHQTRLADVVSAPDMLLQQSQASTQATQSLTIIDVVSDRRLFETFVVEWRSQSHYSLSVACIPTAAPVSIGAKFSKTASVGVSSAGLVTCDEGVEVCGVAVCWGQQDAYFISLTNHTLHDNPDDSLAPPSLDPAISRDQRLSILREILSQPTSVITAFDAKGHYNALSSACDAVIGGEIRDPSIGSWLLDPGANPATIPRLTAKYAPQVNHLLEGLCGGSGSSSLGLHTASPAPPRLRACVESIVVHHVMVAMVTELEQEGLYAVFCQTEMPSVMTLARMELNGMGVSVDELERQKAALVACMEELEQQAYSLAGHTFQLTSPDDVAQVLFRELHLPPSGDPSAPGPRTLGVSRRGRGTLSTSKEVLERLSPLHPLPGVVLQWRRVSTTLAKVVCPLHRAGLSGRIHSQADLHTATGRVTMREPNLQNTPKDFTGGVILAADYSQLELRIIAHLSRDRQLCAILNCGGDMFRQVAAQWRGVGEDDVTDEHRQQAKQVCYGMVYGVGARALAAQLGVSEDNAAVFIDSFKAKYTGMRSFLTQTVQEARERGYVQTMAGRRRYLPALQHTNIHARAHAERQAVNTTVQGSAADLVKTAMVDIDHKLNTLLAAAHHGSRPANRASLILQLHDELIYEVSSSILPQVALLVKHAMETALTLTVAMPVKVKVGSSWGDLQDYTL